MRHRSGTLPGRLRQAPAPARRQKDLSQAPLGKLVGLPQTRFSGIETGRIVPRYDTLLDLVRVLNHDLVLVPRDLVPVVEACSGNGAKVPPTNRRSHCRNPTPLTTLGVHFYGRQIGTITRLAGDWPIFSFAQSYIDDPQRPTLSLSFKGRSGGLVTTPQHVRQRLPTFFANLLPEGHLRVYLAARADVHPQRGFFLRAAVCAFRWQAFRSSFPPSWRRAAA